MQQTSQDSQSSAGRWLIPLVGTAAVATVAYQLGSANCDDVEFNTYCAGGVVWGAFGAFFGFVGGMLVASIVFD